MKKIIALMLAIAALWLCLFSCKKEEAVEADSTEELGETYRINDLQDYDFSGRDFTVLTRTEYGYELLSDYGSSAISQFVYERNLAVTNKYNVNLNIKTEQGAWAYRNQYKDKISESVAAGVTYAYDLIYGAQNQINLYVTEGYFTNLHSNEGLDFENDWWFDGFVDNLTINGKLYFTVGDAGPSLLEYMDVVIFNKDICSDHGIELPYASVREGNWTLEQMEIMANGFGYQDMGNEGIDNTDMFSIVGGGASIRGLTTSFNMNITQRDEMGYPTITFDSQRNIEMIDAFQKFIHDGNRGNFRDDSEPLDAIGSHRALMMLANLADVMNIRQKYDVNYGIVPYPKYDTAQEKYYTHVHETLSVFSVPINAPSRTESGIILEALGAASYDFITPEYFETVLQYQNSKDSDSLEMIKLARENISFNFGFVHSGAIGNIGSLIDGVKNREFNFGTSYKNRNFNAPFNTLLGKYLEMKDK